MEKKLYVLIVEDSEDDALLLVRNLKNGGYEPVWERVENIQTMKAALQNRNWDIILCDYKMPTFSAPEALKLVQEMNLDIPFIVVSGTVGEETAVEVMKAGAQDYLMKDKLARLTAAIAREIREVKMRLMKKSTEELLQKSEDNFRHSLDELPLGVRIINAEGVTIYANREILNIYGYESLEEFNSADHKERYTSHDQAEYKKRAELIATGNDSPTTYHLSIIRKDGQTRHLEVFLKRVLWNGAIQHQALYHDITERKKAEKNLLESEERYRTVVENAHESILIVRGGKIVFANYSAVRDSGYSLNELIGNDFSLFIHSDDRAKVDDFYLRRLKGENVPGHYSFRIRCKDENIKWAELNTTIIDFDGKPATLNFIKDVTERKQLDEERNESFRKIKETLTATVNAIAMIVEARDPYTTGHQKRVALLAEAIASEMGLTSDQKEFITTASVMHDIGKLSVPAEILSKPTKLSPIEYELIKTHSQAGYNILKDISFPWPVAEAILQHHERINGSGYPHHLTGNEMMLEAKIIAVADVVEAISSHRPYRATLGIDYALEEISQNKNILYDPGVVDACLKLFREKNFSLT